jgi:hypothetical protein
MGGDERSVVCVLVQKAISTHFSGFVVFDKTLQ